MLRTVIVGLLLFVAVSDGLAQGKPPAGAVKKRPTPKPNEIKSKLPAAFNTTPNVNLPVKPVKAEQIAKVRSSAARVDELIDAKLKAEGLEPNPEIRHVAPGDSVESRRPERLHPAQSSLRPKTDCI